ncbi:MAG: hypothetical protein Q4A00_07890 [Flavobacteriaceae bacterium]|nr:hypothetical protein [Flavobacteriaceae bacterium]
MMNNFHFDTFLKSKGFICTDYKKKLPSDIANHPIHELYEIEVEEAEKIFYYCVNVQEDRMTTNESKTNNLIIDIPIPKNQKEAEKWLTDFVK